MNKIYQNYQTKIMVGILVLSAALLSISAISAFATSSPTFSGLAIRISGKTATVSFNYTCPTGDSYCENTPDQQFPATASFVDRSSSCNSSDRGDYNQVSLTGDSGSLSGTVNVNGKDGKYLCVEVGETYKSKLIPTPAAAPRAPTFGTPATVLSNNSMPTIQVRVDNSQRNGTVQLFSDSACSNDISATESVRSRTVDVTVADNNEFADGAYTIYAKHTNSDGNGTCSTTSVAYTYDGIAPVKPVAVALHYLSDNPGTVSTPTIEVTVGSEADGGTVTLYTNDDCSAVASSATPVTEKTMDVVANAQSRNTPVTYYATHTDAAGNTSDCSTHSATYTYNTAPVAPRISRKTPTTSVGTTDTPTFRVTVDNSQKYGTVALFADSNCSISLNASASVTADSSTVNVAIPGTHPLDAMSYTVYAKHTNLQNQGTCSTSGVSYTYSTTGTIPAPITVSGLSVRLSGSTATVSFSYSCGTNTQCTSVQMGEIGANYVFLSNNTCNSDTYLNASPQYTVNLTKVANANRMTGTATIDTSENNGKYMCVETLGGASRYASSGVIRNSNRGGGGGGADTTPQTTETKREKRSSGGSGGGVKCLACGGGAGITGPNAQAEAAGASTASVDQIALLEQQVIALMKKLIELLTDEIVVQSTAQNTRQSAPVMQNTLPATASNLMYPVQSPQKRQMFLGGIAQ